MREGCATPFQLTRVKPRSWSLQKTAKPLPRFVIAKRHGYAQCGLLVPNCYFEDLKRWRHITKLIRGEARNRTFATRDDRAFWRGSIRTQPECADEMGNYARTQAVALGARHPSLFDVRCLDCDVRDEATKPCDAYKFDAATKKLLTATLRSCMRHTSASSSSVGTSTSSTCLEVSLGVHSRNLNHLWSVGSVVRIGA